MMLFIVLAIAMVALGLAFVLVPLLRTRRAADVDRAGANLGILKDQLAELEKEHARGAVTPAHYAEAKAELERRVLDEAQGAQPAGKPGAPKGEVVRSNWSARVAAAAVAVTLPIGAALIYARFGDFSAFDPAIAQAPRDDGHAMAPEQIDKMVESLKARLQKEPENPNHWSTLARTYYQMGRFPEAAKAYAKLVTLIPDNADILADYADSLAMAKGRQLAGEPMALVNKALKLDPTQWKALAMAGTEAFDRNDFKGASAFWERLLNVLPPEAPIADQIRSSIADARARGGMPPLQLAQGPAGAKPGAENLPRNHPPLTAARPDTDAAPAPAPALAAPGKAPAKAAGKGDATKPDASKPAAGKATVGGTVDIGSDMKAKAQPTDRVFIIARPAEGSRMPLAFTAVQVKDLPAKFTLDESMAMSPAATLATATTDVVVTARVSKTGSPMPNSGDLEGASKPVKVGAKDVVIKIDRVVP
jgi:cytochrome c-type biogenesis protein CcmH